MVTFPTAAQLTFSADSTLVLAFDYWTVGTGSMSFDVIDVDTDASYFLMADWGYSGRWKSYNVTIPAGANIMVGVTSIDRSIARERERERERESIALPPLFFQSF